ncbi:exo-alpha-sialidase [Tautonia rosea]|uniref:exo-alpha-sialidase n=1 Tax=Tautonia rosea TaxID=2728037 RepID=UPI0019CF4D79|nr:exo-alpha-sialidase [Tautonia rosea]
MRAKNGVNQHNYLVRHRDLFWVMWSDGPGVEDRVGQRVRFATSPDGRSWSEPRDLTPEPPNSGPSSPHYGTRSPEGFRWIARGFWLREDDLYALASLDEADGFFGPSLALHAFRLIPEENRWNPWGVIAEDTINNFPPKRLPTGEWLMSRRPHNYRETGVFFLRGGAKGLNDWESFPVLGSSRELAAEEPLWWVLPNDHLMALFRDNRRGGYLYRAFSTDDGKTWSLPVRTNFPDATSKLHGLRLSDGRYVLASNANPRKRDPLTLAISEDGMVFTKLGVLIGGRQVDYPHVLEHDGSLLIAFSGGKQRVEILIVRLEDLDTLSNQLTPPNTPGN